MNICFTQAILPVLALALSGMSFAGEPVPPGLTASFESGLPETFTAQGGKLSISDDHILDGTKALRWDFKDGDAFTIHTGPLGATNVSTGYNGYSRSVLEFPLYLVQKGPGHLLVDSVPAKKRQPALKFPSFSSAGKNRFSTMLINRN